VMYWTYVRRALQSLRDKRNLQGLAKCIVAVYGLPRMQEKHLLCRK
jgi:hypothetical protein